MTMQTRESANVAQAERQEEKRQQRELAGKRLAIRLARFVRTHSRKMCLWSMTEEDRAEVTQRAVLAVLEAIDLKRIRFVGYAFQIEMKYTAKKLGFSLTEVPITFTDRQHGTSKMSTAIFNEAFWGVFQLRRKKIERKKVQ